MSLFLAKNDKPETEIEMSAKLFSNK